VIILEIKGIVVPMITPFKYNGDIDYDGLKWLIDYTINNSLTSSPP